LTEDLVSPVSGVIINDDDLKRGAAIPQLPEPLDEWRETLRLSIGRHDDTDVDARTR